MRKLSLGNLSAYSKVTQLVWAPNLKSDMLEMRYHCSGRFQEMIPLLVATILVVLFPAMMDVAIRM